MTKMSSAKAVKLAKTVAEVRGWNTCPAGRVSGGGWVFDANGRPICKGWGALVDALRTTKIMRADGAIDWRRMDLLGDAATAAKIRAAAPKQQRPTR